ncbi:MAG: DUF5915 domain-containing protein, partial [Candidatus Altiarchaeota archaeon]
KQLNAKEVEFTEGLEDLTYTANPNFAVLGPTYGKKAPEVAGLIRKNSRKIKKALEFGNSINLEGFEVTSEMVGEIKINIPEKYSASEFSHGKSNGIVYIEKDRSESLLMEALARDVIRNLQELRKKHNLEELQKVAIHLSDSKTIKKMLGDYQDVILREVRGRSIDVKKGVSGCEFEFQDEKIQVDISF